VPSLEQVREYIRASKAENTLRGYQSDWRDFCAWCEVHSLCPLPASAETVASYIGECAGRLKVGSVQRRLNAIAEGYKAVGLESPTHHAIVTNTMKGIRRTNGLNNEAKVTMRKSYGFRTFRVLELALYHSLGRLPEPESTHDFF
jgi:hypothetical protein